MEASGSVVQQEVVMLMDERLQSTAGSMGHEILLYPQRINSIYSLGKLEITRYWK